MSNHRSSDMSMGVNADGIAASDRPTAARVSTSIRDPTEAALVATSAAGLIPIAAPDAALPATPQTVTAAEPLEPRERVYASQLKLARSHDDHDPHERVASIRAAMAEADAVALSQRIVRASTISEHAAATPRTVFDQIITRKVPAFVVYEDDDVLAFHDSAPQAPVHIVIVPKFRDGLTGLSAAEERHKKILGQLLYTASRVARMEEKLRDGYRIVINEGGYGGQTVLHLHLHLLGGRFMQWPPG